MTNLKNDNSKENNLQKLFKKSYGTFLFKVASINNVCITDILKKVDTDPQFKKELHDLYLSAIKENK